MSDTDSLVQTVLANSQGLPPNQRLVLVTYASSPKRKADGTVEATAQALAESLGWAPTVFSRTRKELIEAGHLEERGRINNVVYYRLAAKVTARSRPKVVHLRPAG